MIGTVDRVSPRDKIVTIDDLPRIRERLRGKHIVHCHGAFDLVHIGHLTHFEEARSLGDLLVVTITADRHITKKRSITFSTVAKTRSAKADGSTVEPNSSHRPSTRAKKRGSRVSRSSSLGM